jgi:steroid delta-isomerase-like uncharacterized protein
MNPLEIASRYFDAWNARDPDAVVAMFSEGGTYRDPARGIGLTGQQIADRAAGLWAAFPDLSFQTVRTDLIDQGTVAVQWLMRGTNTGSMLGLPPTGGRACLPGADFITVDAGKIRSVHAYFDQQTLAEQLGLQVVVQPQSAGPFRFGYSIGVQSGKTTRPGAFSLTHLNTRSAQDVYEVGSYSLPTAAEMLEMPGFLSWIGVVIGHDMFTVTAWEDPASPKQLLEEATHKVAVRRFFDNDLAPSGLTGVTGVWVPHHLNTVWVRCPECGYMTDADAPSGTCECGEALPERVPYW